METLAFEAPTLEGVILGATLRSFLSREDTSSSSLISACFAKLRKAEANGPRA